ncbi:MAG TPA: hypothetical protein VJT83_01650 [Chitinophagaceae bacterium]|nr:hypothetical protein [Chitinophagaceae bacterium]
MIRFQDLKVGDHVMAEFEGQWTGGEIAELNREDKEVCVRAHGGSEYWYKPEELRGIPLTDEQLASLGFTKESDTDGPVKYKKGAFRILLSQKDDFQEFEMWYREDRRHMKGPISVHQLQNHYHDMTKIHLTTEVA